MLRYGVRFKSFLMAVAVVFAVFAFSTHAWAAVAGIDKGILNTGSADFGNGGHYLGSPTQPYTITWDYSVSGSTLIKTPRIQGYLYVDSLFGGGCARLRVLYQNHTGTTITSQTLQVCGPGFDANNQLNQLKVDVSKSGVEIARVRLITGFGSSSSTIQDVGSATWDEPTVQVTTFDTLTNQDWTFTLDGGDGVNIFPSEFLTFGGSYGTMFASARGNLTSNNFVFVPRVIFDYFDATGNLLESEIWDIAEGFAPVSSRELEPDTFKVRLRLGELDVFHAFTNVVAKTYSLGPAVGDAECTPFATGAVANNVSTTSLRWTVPGTANWHSLDAIDIRLVDDSGEILQVRWDEASNQFFFYDPDSHQYRGPAEPGTNARFERPEVAMELSNTQVIGSGPQGPSVLLNLGLRFKPKAAGRTFQVEARASDKSGTAQGWTSAGTITVLPQR
jgi:hypothetical protein